MKLDTDFGMTLPEFDSSNSILETLNSIRRAVETQKSWEVKADVLFGAFSFHKEAMYQDLKKNEAAVLENTLLHAVAGDSDVAGELTFDPVKEDQVDIVGPPETMASILDADSTQRCCILAARDGKTFVMDGPPGTGKSRQLPTSLRNFLRPIRRCCSVSEKAAALEVVKSRLDRSQIGSYVLELHSNKATRKEVAQTLGDRAERAPSTSHREYRLRT